MTAIKEAAADFLACRRIAVTGVSRAATGHGGNTIYTRLRDRGFEVFAVNPNADEVEGDRCYHRLADIDDGVDAVVIATRPDAANDTVHECIELGIDKIWMHRAFGAGSLDRAAVAYGREHGAMVIDGGCPLMFDPVSDGAHKFLKLVCTRRVPRHV